MSTYSSWRGRISVSKPPLISLWGGITLEITFKWHLKLRFGGTGLWEARKVLYRFRFLPEIWPFQPTQISLCWQNGGTAEQRVGPRETNGCDWLSEKISQLAGKLWASAAVLTECLGIVFTCRKHIYHCGSVNFSCLFTWTYQLLTILKMVGRTSRVTKAPTRFQDDGGKLSLLDPKNKLVV